LVNLEYLWLHRNNLDGQVPSSISNLINLKHLEIWSNQLTGPILSYIADLNQIEHIEIDQNQFTGEIPSEIGNLSNLNVLYAASNQFTGEIPSEIGNLSNLNTLMLAQNQLSGNIPEAICNLNLSPIWEDEGSHSFNMFNNNQFCPPYPECINQYVSFEEQNLDNCFSCEDEDVYNLWGDCYHVDYTSSINKTSSGISGPIPQELEYFVNLNYLGLRNNDMTGTISDFICNINDYDLTENSFCGPFPDCINGDFIFPQNNSYECSEYCNNDTEVNLWGICNGIQETTQINLNNAEITGEIPSEIGNLINLERLYLNGNQISGEIPAEIGNLINLERLYLKDNQISGEIPPEIGNLNSLERLYLNENQLSGHIPPEIGNLFNLTHLYLSDNLLSGEIPFQICEQGDSSPDLENNYFCPPYPVCLNEDDIGFQDTLECLECTQGDINSDSLIDILDIVLMANMIIDEHVYNECTDVNSDYVLDVLDIILIINIILDA